MIDKQTGKGLCVGSFYTVYSHAETTCTYNYFEMRHLFSLQLYSSRTHMLLVCGGE